ncbi:MHS family proline/betaine transporter-like MFS transporter [Scopulibacillus darangshiensis]|uniref:Putative proline/betaine transporter n=1 Tax=Scopulibacillus darangshiensis TaxID=442528 RepID=A0A4V2SKT3_9BACL|nr:MFS transporter [Scopulibacillus darangshiensis]TCP20716.1 MHS family proline/betaine transporter-like MFS transporter [Scopulibacillus darangshiensis]
MAIKEQAQDVMKTSVNVQSSGVKKAVFGAAIGNLIEWFDYASYGYLATIIAAVFFAPGNATAALLGTFGVFAVSFIARPFGGLFWGYFGDKIGRKKVLALTIIIMSLSTVAVGLIPSYASIGMAAPLLLLVCRVVQGFSASGEYAGSALFIAEYVPRSRRGLLVSMVPASTAFGLLLGALVAALLEYNLTPHALHSWGWRIPFLAAGPLGLIGLYIRSKTEDTPVFKEMEQSHETAHTPAFIGLKQNLKQILVAFGVVCLNAVGFYTILSYMPTYLSSELGFEGIRGILTTIFPLLAYVLFLPIIGLLADRVGRKPILIGACVMFVLFTYPIFLLLSLGGMFSILALILLGAILAGNDGVLATFLSEMFPTSVRYTGFGLSFNMGNAIFGGTAPFIATFLIAQTNNMFAPAFYLMASALAAFIALLRTKETVDKSLKEETHSETNFEG